MLSLIKTCWQFPGKLGLNLYKDLLSTTSGYFIEDVLAYLRQIHGTIILLLLEHQLILVENAFELLLMEMEDVYII